MKSFPLIFFLLLASILHAEIAAEPPSDVFLRAYAAYQKGEKLAVVDDKSGALEAFKESESILATLRKSYPEWNPAIVNYRHKRVCTEIEKLEHAKPADTPQHLPSAPILHEPVKKDTPAEAIFIQAFSVFQKGEKLVVEDDKAGALKAFKESESILTTLRKSHPNWNPAIVAYRHKRVCMEIEKLELAKPADTPQ